SNRLRVDSWVARVSDFAFRQPIMVSCGHLRPPEPGSHLSWTRPYNQDSATLLLTLFCHRDGLKIELHGRAFLPRICTRIYPYIRNVCPRRFLGRYRSRVKLLAFGCDLRI